MMEITPIIEKERLSKEQIEYLQKQQTEYKLLGKQRRIPGHTLFSFNMKTGEIKKAAVKPVVTIISDNVVAHKTEIAIEPFCYYEQALNEKSFVKRLKRNGLIK